MDATHDIGLRCWVASAIGHGQFPIQNLPVGIFAPAGGHPRGGIAIGDCILDIRGLLDRQLLGGDAKVAAAAASGDVLNPFFQLGGVYRQALRSAVSGLLSAEDAKGETADLLHPAAQADIVSRIHHAFPRAKDFFSPAQQAS